MECFINWPRGHHAACACASCRSSSFFFFHSCLPSFAHSFSLWCYFGVCPSVDRPAGWVKEVDARYSSPLHGLPTRHFLLCGDHPTQDQPPQPGRPPFLPMGEGDVCAFCSSSVVSGRQVASITKYLAFPSLQCL